MESNTAYKLVSHNYTSLNTSGKYELEYPFGEIVKAPEGTLGIMVFRSMKELLWFAPIGNIINHDLHILRVTMTGTIKLDQPDICLITTDEGLDEFYNGNTKHLAPAPAGTTCCDEIRVLDWVPVEKVGDYA